MERREGNVRVVREKWWGRWKKGKVDRREGVGKKKKMNDCRRGRT